MMRRFTAVTCTTGLISHHDSILLCGKQCQFQEDPCCHTRPRPGRTTPLGVPEEAQLPALRVLRAGGDGQAGRPGPDAFAICRKDDARLDAALASVTQDVLALLAGPREVVAAGTVPMTPADHRLSASTPILCE